VQQKSDLRNSKYTQSYAQSSLVSTGTLYLPVMGHCKVYGLELRVVVKIQINKHRSYILYINKIYDLM